MLWNNNKCEQPQKQVSLLIVVEPMNDEMSQMTFASDIDSDQSGHLTSLSLHCKHDEKTVLSFQQGHNADWTEFTVI